MYCSKCGNNVTNKLNYCNNCGAKMANDESVERKPSPLGVLISSLPFIVLGGLGILIGLLAMLLNKGVTHETVAIIAVFYLAALTSICFGLIRVLSKLISINYDKQTDRVENYQTPQLSMPTNPQLNEYHQPIGSVTEHTTKSIDEFFVKRN